MEKVKCCKDNEKHNSIYYDDSDDPCFRLTDSDDPIEYCPWCGILLDTNLLED